MRKRMTSLLLTLVMLLSLLPAMGVTASAADDRSYTQAEIRNYKSFESYLRSSDSRDLKLMEDINYTVGINDVSINVIRNQKLDLNGHKITIDASRRAGFENLLCIRYGEFTLYDSQGGGELAVSFPNDDKAYSIIMMSSEKKDEPAKFTMNGGTLTKLHPNMTYTYGASGCIGDDYFNKPENGKRSQITINGGTINCPYEWDRSQSLLDFEVEAMPLALQLRYSNLTINGGTFNGIVWTDTLWRGEQDTEPRVVLNGGEFNSPFVVEGMQKDATQIVIDGAHFKDGFHVNNGYSINTDVGTVPVLLLKSGVFDSPDKNPKLDIYNVTANSYGNGVNPDATARARLEMILHAMKCFPNSAIKVNGKFYTSENIESLVGKNNDDFYLKLNSSTPIEVIRDAWGVMESVTLDGNPINYAKDWQGGFEEMDNSTAHTIKFNWKPLAAELSAAGYSYNAKCEHYISGSTAVQQTDTIAAGATSHTVTIPAGADPKVYSFALHLNLKKGDKNIGIISNEHIVKLVVNQAPVVVPDPTLAGKVYYTSGIVYGSRISTGTGDLPHGFDSSKLLYQWQRSTDSGSTWKNIPGETRGSYTPVEADMGENVRIRVKVTAEGYLGEIVGAALKVSKAANNEYPEVIKLEAVQDEAGNYTGFKIKNYDPDCEYVYSETSEPDWSENQIGSDTVTGLTSDKTYYVFARFRETKTHTAGSIVSRNSIRLYGYVPLQYVSLEGYDSGNTIYIKEGESVELKVSADPSNANYWNEITFKDSSTTGTSNITISNEKIAASGTTATAFPNDHSITITGSSVGSATLDASYSGPTLPYYGRWDVVVYDDSTVADALRLENVYTYADITLSENDEADLPIELPKLLPENSGYHLEWRIVKVGSGGASYKTSDDNITLVDGKIKPQAAHAASASTRLELVAVKEGEPIKSFSPPSVFNVTVTEAPTVELTGVIVAPAKVNLGIGDTITLSAVKEPVNAAGSLTWTSDNSAVAEVDNTGKVTAVAKGEATITVSCNGKSASCTVTVDHTHNTNSQTWAPLNDNEHFRSCTAGDETQIEAHKFNSWTANTDDKTHTGTCTECGYAKTENHSWVVYHEDAPTATDEGTRYYKCSATGCTATKSESIPKLTEYTVTVKDDGNGTASADHIKAVAGTEIKLTATANSGYHFKEWQVVKGGMTITNNKFTMPAENVEVKAIFEKNTSTGGGGGGGGVTTYAITVKSAKNGDVTVSPRNASKGTTVTLTVEPDKGYTLETITVTDKNGDEIALTNKGDGKYTFKMPAGKVYVEATFMEDNSMLNFFVDVFPGDYYYDAVLWAAKNGITGGVDDTHFAPNGICTRAQAVTFLWRAAGSPAPKTSTMPFTDVKAGSYYEQAVLWAVENGITDGTSATTFSPDAVCSRGQIVTFLWRSQKSPASDSVNPFADVAADAYYNSAVLWAAENGITGGTTATTFSPNNDCTRAQIVTFLYRCLG